MQETEDSDTESVRSQVMEDEERTTPRPEEDDRGQTATNPMFCSVVLDRLKLEEITAGKELEEKEDMNRKSGKQSISRIPTFQSTKKRPISGSHSTELQLPPKDIPSDAAEPQPKAGSGAVEVPKSRLYGITALPLPTARLPSKVASEAPSISHTEQAALSTDDTLTSASQESGWMAEPVHVGVMVTPRPAIRVDQGDRALEKEADLAQDLIPHPPSFSQTLQVDAADMWEVDVGEEIHLSASGDTENLESEEAIGGDGENVSQVQAIMDEEPPWEAEPVKSDFVLEEEDSSSSSDIQHIDDPPVEKWAFGGIGESGEVNGSQKQNISLQNVPPKSTTLPEDSSDTDEPTISAVLHEPVKASQSTRRSSCPNFGFCFLLPITLLLLGGFGQHVWQYGLPMSVAHLTAQLELHWLEGIGLVEEPCGSDCRVRLVESVPEDLFYSDPLGLSSISDSWLHLLKEANSSVRIAAFYFTLRNTDDGLTQPTDSQGRKVLDQLKELKAKAVKLQIAVNTPQTSSQDTSELAATGAEIREVDLQSVTGGIVHTKLWVVDQKHIYLGSANMDWRSLSQVKEVGISVEDCSCLAQDAHRIFEVYWNIGAEENGSLPPYWPARLSALSSSQRPLHLKFNGVPSRVYLSSAPSLISTRGRTDDLSSILSVIADAQKFIHISVMDYLPLSQFTKPLRNIQLVRELLHPDGRRGLGGEPDGCRSG
ncbi:uncharacterized protein pld7 isoform X2 [Lampris incognitus]|uniref:uncharacterized protein pld7 isoform X2 n=1 Tax=Lampris incognitus TaxID=2546036 RepID=UPI0024B61637|nr:uncharacterized protein pld7 isoform X2 [Lampris incognitus]